MAHRSLTKRIVRPASRKSQPRLVRGSSTRKQRSVARRDSILKAALAEFSAQGYATTRLDDVARRAHVAKGTIYLYFRDKESLFQELIRAMLTPLVGAIEALHKADAPIDVLADQIVEVFVRDIFETPRKDVIRLMLVEGRRFPKLAEFYYREVLSRIMTAMRALLTRAVERGQAPAALAQFPQLLAAPGIVAIIWSGLFERFEPLDVRAMLKAHVRVLFGSNG